MVKVYATTQNPNYDTPWMGTAPSSSTGSGVVIGRGQVLTGAHVVANATFVQIQKLDAPSKVIARVAAVSHDLDLALLEVTEPGYLAEVPVAKLGPLPKIQDRVSVVGYPVGGEEVSITEGVVSRIEVQEYAHSQRCALAVTVDAAINDGNSGGPVVLENAVVGIAFQTREGAEAIGEIVPVPLIEHFMTAVAEGRRTSLPGIGVRTMKLENPVLRRRLGLGPDDGGVLVTGVAYGGSASGHIRPGDVLLSVNGLDVAENATVLYRGQFRTAFDVVLGDHHVGDVMSAAVLRDGQRVALEIELRDGSSLVPGSQYDRSPTYLVFGGLVFQPLTRDFLEAWTKWWHQAPKELLHIYQEGLPTEARRGVVVVAQILADEVNVGYTSFSETTVSSVDGVAPRDIRHFAELLAQARGPEIEICTSFGGQLLFSVEAARAANARILERYRIPRVASEDLGRDLERALLPREA
ncbi:MAG: serine protease [Myxococcota bacterium]